MSTKKKKKDISMTLKKIFKSLYVFPNRVFSNFTEVISSLFLIICQVFIKIRVYCLLT